MWLADLFGSSREQRYFDMLARQASILVKAARTLKRYVETGDVELVTKVAMLEDEGDKALRALIDALRDTFVTPLDRQDLYNLGEAIDDIIDYVDSAAAEIKLFGVHATPAMREMCGVLVEAAVEIAAAVGAISNNPGLAYDHARETCRTENRMEETYRHALAALFDGDDVRAMMKVREIYRHLSNSADRADAVGKLIGKIVVKTT